MDLAVAIVTLVGFPLAIIGLWASVASFQIALTSNAGAILLDTNVDFDASKAFVKMRAVGPGSWYNVNCQLQGVVGYTSDREHTPKLVSTDPEIEWNFDLLRRDAGEHWFVIRWDEPYRDRMRQGAVSGPIITPDKPLPATWHWHWKKFGRARTVYAAVMPRWAIPDELLGGWKAHKRSGLGKALGPYALLDKLRGL